MNQKIALVIGSTSDIGQGISLMLSENGYDLAAHYLKNDLAAQSLKEKAEKNGVRVKLLKGNLMQEEEAQKIVQQTINTFGRIDVLINNTGPFESWDIFELTPQQWKSTLELNLNVVFNTIYFSKDYLIQSRGHIINFSFAGSEYLKPREVSVGYCTAKAGVVLLTKSFATRFARFGVRVNSICPGAVDDSALLPESRERFLQAIPAARLCHIDEIVETIKWLILESPSYLTGSLVPLSGGWEY